MNKSRTEKMKKDPMFFIGYMYGICISVFKERMTADQAKAAIIELAKKTEGE